MITSYWYLKDKGRTFRTREEAEVELQRLNALGYRNRQYSGIGNSELQVEELNSYYGDTRDRYYVEYSEPVGEPVPFQFHSQECMISQHPVS